MTARLIWIAAGGLLLLIALGNLAVVSVMTQFKPERGPLALHAPDHPEGASPYLATPPEVVTAMLQLAGVRPGETVYDLGCGDARILVSAARDFGARGVGVELDTKVFDLARQNVRRAGVEQNVRLVKANMFETDVRSADVVALYLLPEALEKLRPHLEQQLRQGARVVTHDFEMPGWKAVVTSRVPRGDGTAHTVHLYRR